MGGNFLGRYHSSSFLGGLSQKGPFLSGKGTFPEAINLRKDLTFRRRTLPQVYCSSFHETGQKKAFLEGMSQKRPLHTTAATYRYCYPHPIAKMSADNLNQDSPFVEKVAVYVRCLTVVSCYGDDARCAIIRDISKLRQCSESATACSHVHKSCCSEAI